MLMNNYYAQQQFLNMIKEFAISNPDKEITSNFIYSNLAHYKINLDNIQNTRPLFNYWQEIFKINNNVDVFEDSRMKSFCFFTNGRIRGNEIKIYIPLDINHLKEGAYQLFNFIASTGMEHQSKIADRIRSDNVVIRVNNLDDANKIINYVENNDYIKKGMLQINPFLPNYNGIGLTMDNNYSYNSNVADLICDFINELKKRNNLNACNVDNFHNYVGTRVPTMQDEDQKDICILIHSVTSPNFKINDFIEHVNYKMLDKYNGRERITNPKIYFEEAVKTTYGVHPENAKVAISEYLKGNPNYFTNVNRSRESLIKHVSPGDLIPLMRSKLSMPPHSDSELINTYLSQLLDNYKSRDFYDSYVYNYIKTAYIKTRDKYNEAQAIGALRRLLVNSNPECFTGKECRDTLNEFINKGVDIKRIILSNIDINDLDVNDIDEIINRFRATLASKKTIIYNPV